jgi:hypothetical protein
MPDVGREGTCGGVGGSHSCATQSILVSDSLCLTRIEAEIANNLYVFYVYFKADIALAGGAGRDES